MTAPAPIKAQSPADDEAARDRKFKLDSMRLAFLKRRIAQAIERGEDDLATRLRDQVQTLFWGF